MYMLFNVCHKINLAILSTHRSMDPIRRVGVTWTFEKVNYFTN